MKRKVQAQRKFAQGAPIPANIVSSSERKIDTTPNKEDRRNVVRNNTAVKALLDIISFKQIHKHKRPVVLLERLRTNSVNSHIVQRHGEDEEPHSTNDTDSSNSVTENDHLIRNLNELVNDSSNTNSLDSFPTANLVEPAVNNNLNVNAAIAISTNKNTMRLRSHNRIPHKGSDEALETNDNPTLIDECPPKIDKTEFEDAPRDKVNDMRSFLNLTQPKRLYRPSNFSCDMSDISLDEDKPLAQYVLRKKLSAKPNIPKRRPTRITKKAKQYYFGSQLPKVRRNYDWRKNDRTIRPKRPITPPGHEEITSGHESEGMKDWRKNDRTIRPKRSITPPGHEEITSGHESEGMKDITDVPVTDAENKKRQTSETSDIVQALRPVPLKKRRFVPCMPTLQSPECEAIKMVASLTRNPRPSEIVIYSSSPPSYANIVPLSVSMQSEVSELPCPMQNMCSFANVVEAPLNYIAERCEKCTHCIKLQKFIQIRVMVEITNIIFTKYYDHEPTIDEENYFRLINLWDDWLNLTLDIIKEPKNNMLHVSYTRHEKKLSRPALFFSLVIKVSSDSIPVEAPVSREILEYLRSNFIITTKGTLEFITYSENIFIANNGMSITKKANEVERKNSMSSDCNNVTSSADERVFLSPQGQQNINVTNVNYDRPPLGYYCDVPNEENMTDQCRTGCNCSTIINSDPIQITSSSNRKGVIIMPDHSMASSQVVLPCISGTQSHISVVQNIRQINNKCDLNAGNTITENYASDYTISYNNECDTTLGHHPPQPPPYVSNCNRPIILSNQIIKGPTQTQVKPSTNTMQDFNIQEESLGTYDTTKNINKHLFTANSNEQQILDIYDNDPVNISDEGNETCTNTAQLNSMYNTNTPMPTLNSSKRYVTSQDFTETFEAVETSEAKSDTSSYYVNAHPANMQRESVILSTVKKRYQPVFNSTKNKGPSTSPPQKQPTHGHHFLDAPVYYLKPEDFHDPMAFFDSIAPSASKFGICKVVPPKEFRPSCTVNDEMNFSVTNQYITRFYSRWGPGPREMSTIKAYLASQSVFFKRAPLYEGMEVNLPKLYQIVQRLGGLNKVIERKKWTRVAEELRFTKGPNPEKKLDQFYVKYLLPYDTLSALERGTIMSHVERIWCAKYRKLTQRAFAPLQRQQKILVGSESSGSSEDGEGPDDDPYITGALNEAEECVMQGRKMNLTTFKKVAANAWEAFFENTCPSSADIEEEYWRLVLLAAEHLCVITASVDTSSGGYGFPTGAHEKFTDHPWNIKNLATNKKNILRYLGGVLGVTLSTLHLQMVFSTSCWHSDPHGLPWMEFMHGGSTKIWYGIPGDQGERFRTAVESLCPATCQNKTIWLPSEIAMIPPNLLKEHNVNICRLEQDPGEFVVVFPKAYSSSISTGFTISESVYFATTSWLMNGMEYFKEAQTSCEPTVVSIECLLLSIAADKSVPLSVLQPTLVLLNEMVENEVSNRKFVEEELKLRKGRAEVQYLKHESKEWNVRDHDECEVCHKSLYVSRVRGFVEPSSFICMDHAATVIRNKPDVPVAGRHFQIDYFFTTAEISFTLQAAKHRMCRMT